MSDRHSHQRPPPTPAAAQAADGLSLPAPVSLPSNLSRKLQDLPPYQMQFVDSMGTLHSDKSAMLEKKIPPLVSFRKESNDSFRVYAGLPPRNMTHCGTGEIPDRNELNKLPNMQGPVILNSGDWMALTGKLPVTIPLFRTTHPQTPEDKLAELIASADVGQTVVLGRSVVPECPSEVSRAHISVTVLDRQQLSPTRVAIRIVAIPGIEGTQPIFHLKPDGQLEQIIGSKEIPAGGIIQIGERGERFTLPYPKDSLDDASIVYHQSILIGDKEANNSIIGVFGREGLRQAQFHALRDYVLKALDMIREGNSVGALNHLREQSKELQAAGYSLSENNQIMLPRLTRDAIENNLDNVAKRSWFKSGQMEIYPSIGVLGPKAQPTNEEEHKLLALWQKNVALIYAEEYVHALQEMNGGAISDYTPLFGGKHEIDDEADVALFFKRHGIDLSDGLFVNRYPVRPTALDRVEGTQTRDEEGLFKARVLAAPLNTPVPINQYVTVSRTEAGYVVIPSQSLESMFYMKPHGTARELAKPVTLQGGDHLFLGSKTFSLPLATR